MVQVVKSEWHQIERRYGYDIDRDIFGEIYCDIEDEAEIDLMFLQFENGEIPIEEVLDKADEENVELFWEWLDQDDWYTERKGGFDVTYQIE